MKNKKYMRMLRYLMTTVVFVLLFAAPVYATSEVTAKINNIYELVLGIVQAAGAVVCVWGVFDFASAYQAHDSSSQTQALKKCIAGIIMVLAGSVVTLLK